MLRCYTGAISQLGLLAALFPQPDLQIVELCAFVVDLGSTLVVSALVVCLRLGGL